MRQPLLDKLRNEGKAGLVLFSSGTSGESKAIVHDFTKLIENFMVKRTAFRTIAFLPLDHMGGLNTMLHTLYNGGCLIVPQRKDPETICKIIQDYEVELLPVTPTFLNLLLISQVYKKYDLSSLRVITYGTEPMNPVTLERLTKVFKDVKIKQTYGLSELGVFPSKSKDGTLWLKLGIKTRIRNGMLEIKTDSAMLGYINAPSPFTSDGWFMTGDKVEQDGEYMRIIGRESDIINVGGNKVYPQEVENVISELDNIQEVTAFAEDNPILGSMVSVKITCVDPDPMITKRIKKHCRNRLESFKVPVKIYVKNTPQDSNRFKKKRHEQVS